MAAESEVTSGNRSSNLSSAPFVKISRTYDSSLTFFEVIRCRCGIRRIDVFGGMLLVACRLRADGSSWSMDIRTGPVNASVWLEEASQSRIVCRRSDASASIDKFDTMLE